MDEKTVYIQSYLIKVQGLHQMEDIAGTVNVSNIDDMYTFIQICISRTGMEVIVALIKA